MTSQSRDKNKADGCSFKTFPVSQGLELMLKPEHLVQFPTFVPTETQSDGFLA